MSNVYLGLGTNLGDRTRNLQLILDYLKDEVELVKVSSSYETEPVGFLDQPKFLNAVCLIQTSLEPYEVLNLAKSIELEIGPRAKFRNGPRYSDIDILLYDDLIIEESFLSIPHKKLANRAFVLVPLLEIAPHLIHPILNCTLKKLLALVDEPWGVNKIQ